MKVHIRRLKRQIKTKWTASWGFYRLWFHLYYCLSALCSVHSVTGYSEYFIILILLTLGNRFRKKGPFDFSFSVLFWTSKADFGLFLLNMAKIKTRIHSIWTLKLFLSGKLFSTIIKWNSQMMCFIQLTVFRHGQNSSTPKCPEKGSFLNSAPKIY